jgi:iron complex transport system permease protein
MHFGDGRLPAAYLAHIGRKRLYVVLALAALAGLFVASVSLGPVRVPPLQVVAAFFGQAASPRDQVIVMSIRLPQSLAAAVAGVGLSVAGAAMQSILRNPWVAVHPGHLPGRGLRRGLLGDHPGQRDHDQHPGGRDHHRKPYLTTAMAFAFCLAAALVVVAVSRLRGATPEVMVLTGVALGALFTPPGPCSAVFRRRPAACGHGVLDLRGRGPGKWDP